MQLFDLNVRATTPKFKTKSGTIMPFGIYYLMTINAKVATSFFST